MAASSSIGRLRVGAAGSGGMMMVSASGIAVEPRPISILPGIVGAIRV
jgi:hypothetical protein